MKGRNFSGSKEKAGDTYEKNIAFQCGTWTLRGGSSSEGILHHG